MCGLDSATYRRVKKKCIKGLISFPAFYETRALRCPARVRIFTTHSIPLTFMGQDSFVLLYFGKDILFFVVAVLLFFFQSVGEGLFSVCLATHKHTTVTSPKWRKKNTCFLWISIESYSKYRKGSFSFYRYTFFFCSPLISADQKPS